MTYVTNKSIYYFEFLNSENYKWGTKEWKYMKILRYGREH